MCIAQNFNFVFENFSIIHGFALNVMGIETKDVQSNFKKKHLWEQTADNEVSTYS